MTVVKRQNAKKQGHRRNYFSEGILKEPRYQSPALATLIYVDWLPTGQWSAVSPIVYSRGSQISLCRHSYIVDGSNLKMAEAPSGYLPVKTFGCLAALDYPLSRRAGNVKAVSRAAVRSSLNADRQL